MNQLHLSEITRREQLFDLINDPGELVIRKKRLLYSPHYPKES
jgi:hypothetical protein